MLQQRRKQIVDRLREKGVVRVIELVEQYGVSIETIRRDLEALEEGGYLKRVYGGAVTPGIYGLEPAYENRETTHLAEKQRIGELAAKQINDGETLFVDIGTTTLEVVKSLRGRRLTIITNSLLIAKTAAQTTETSVVLVGGMLRAGEFSISGAPAVDMISHFNADRVVLGVGGLTLDGVSDYHTEESAVRRAMIARAGIVMAVADSSKFDVVATNQVCSLSDIDLLVTDSGAPLSKLRQMQQAGLNFLLA